MTSFQVGDEVIYHHPTPLTTRQIQDKVGLVVPRDISCESSRTTVYFGGFLGEWNPLTKWLTLIQVEEDL